ncbi:MAG TPA: peptidoglycan-binding domain-containing protein [Bryobacteraceae bacterium]|nr:peptidoglycan-binding domain-containing protein [Bryobacteraceae bacterium]
MRKLFHWAILSAMLFLTYSAGAVVPAKKKAPAKKTADASTAKSTASRRGKTTTASRRPSTTWRNRQLQPAPERYKEIQQALAAKGYLQREDATGQWTPASSEALKKFQTDQNLEGSGKINSLSLIALGLGPKREATANPATGPGQEPPPVPSRDR